MPPVGQSFFAGVAPAARRARAALRRPARSRRARYWTPRAVPGARRVRGRGRGELRAAARRLDPAAPAQRRAGRHVAQRRRRLVGASSAWRPSWPATTAATRSPRASPASSATSGLRRDGRRGGRRRRAPRRRADAPTSCSPTCRALVRDHEEPFGSSSIYAQWRVMQRGQAAGVTVLLDGQGADELFAGYRHLWGPAVRSLPLREAVGAVARDRSLLAPVALSLGYERMPGPAARAYRRLAASPYAARGVVAAAARAGAPEPVARAGWRNGNPLPRELLREAFELQPAGAAALRGPQQHGPQPRGAAAVPRPPRRRVRALAAACPALPAGSAEVDPARRRPRGVVPDAILDRRDKIGFETPQARWFAEPGFRTRIAEILLDPAARARGLYDTARDRARPARRALARPRRALARAQRRALAARAARAAVTRSTCSAIELGHGRVGPRACGRRRPGGATSPRANASSAGARRVRRRPAGRSARRPASRTTRAASVPSASARIGRPTPRYSNTLPVTSCVREPAVISSKAVRGPLQGERVRARAGCPPRRCARARRPSASSARSRSVKVPANTSSSRAAVLGIVARQAPQRLDERRAGRGRPPRAARRGPARPARGRADARRRARRAPRRPAARGPSRSARARRSHRARRGSSPRAARPRWSRRRRRASGAARAPRSSLLLSASCATADGRTRRPSRRGCRRSRPHPSAAGREPARWPDSGGERRDHAVEVLAAVEAHRAPPRRTAPRPARAPPARARS